MELDGAMVGRINTDGLVITPESLRLIAELDEFKGAWTALGRISTDRLAALRHIATVASVGSSTRIEGAKLSDNEVERLLAGLDIASFQSRDEEEVAGYAEVIETVLANWDAIDLSNSHIKQLHRDLLRHVDKDARHRGEYKTLDNHVEAFDADGKSLGVIFQTAPPFETPRRMTDLIDWTKSNLEGRELHALIVIAIFTVVFLAIHPFQDGNGRLSRLLTTLLLLRAGYDYAPYSSLESVVERNKEAYYLALCRTQGTIETDTPDWQPWLSFFLQSLQQQKNELATKLARERLVLGDLPELSARILEMCRTRERITVAEAVRLTGANRNTIKDHLRALTHAGHLDRHGAGRGSWYSPR